MKTIEFNSVNYVLKEFGLSVISKMTDKLKSEGSTSFAKGFKSIVTDDSLTITMGADAEYIDQGRKPGNMPPISAISDWAKRKGIPTDAVFAIAKSIGDKGVEGKDFLNLFEKDSNELEEKFTEAIAEDVVINIEDNFLKSK